MFINRLIPLLIVIIIPAMPVTGEAQFLHLTIEIDSDLSAEELSPLQFDQAVPDAGVIRIALGDPNMGTYTISGPQNLMVNLSVDMPDYLEMGGAQWHRIPMDLEVAYANRNQNNINHATPVSGRTARFALREDAPQQRAPDAPVPRATAYLYVYGLIEVGNVPPGVYVAEVNLLIEYE